LFKCETKDRKKPIDIAAEYGNINVFKDVFEKYFGDMQEFPKINTKESTATLINAAVSHRDNEILSFLKEQHNHLLHPHRNILHFACRQLHGHKMISHLIDDKSIMYQDKKTGSSPLMVAVQHRRLECVTELLKSNVASKEEAIHLVSPVTLRTVFHICAEVKTEDITLVLCQPRYLSTLLVLAADLQGDTPLHICAKVGNAHMTKILLDYIENNSSSIYTEVIPHSATRRTMTNLDANGRVPSKPTPTKLHTTTQQTSNVSLLDTMLLKKNKNKYIPLHVAIYYGNFNVIETIFFHLKSFSHSNLLETIINARDDQKRTSLHMAAEKGEEVINFEIYINEFFQHESILV
jgi:ankyrin repeat protein